MTISRRLALGCASALAVTGSGTELGFASVARQVRGTFGSRSVQAVPQTAQRFRVLLVHRDEAGGTPHFATLSVRAPDTAWIAIDTLDEAGYRQAFDKYAWRGYRLRRLSAFQTRKGTRYATIWQLASGAEWKTRHAMTGTEFEQASADFAAQGYRLTHVDGGTAPSGPRYAAIWERGNGAGQHCFAALTSADYKEKSETLSAKGFRPRQISGYAVDNQARFAALFEAGSATVADHQMTAAAFQGKSDAMTAQGYRLTDASGHMLGGQPMFSGVWEKA